MKAFNVNIIGLSNKAHQFDYEIGNAFFENYGKDMVSDGHFSANVVLDKHERFIEAEFKIKGEAKLICDLSLEPFDFQINIDKRIMFKFGEEEAELSPKAGKRTQSPKIGPGAQRSEILKKGYRTVVEWGAYCFLNPI